MAYCGPTTKIELIASARSNKFGYKAVIITRRWTPTGIKHDQTHVIGKTRPTREDAIALAQRGIDRIK